jgi:hypothetical protein
MDVDRIPCPYIKVHGAACQFRFSAVQRDRVEHLVAQPGSGGEVITVEYDSRKRLQCDAASA